MTKVTCLPGKRQSGVEILRVGLIYNYIEFMSCFVCWYGNTTRNQSSTRRRRRVMFVLNFGISVCVS